MLSIREKQSIGKWLYHVSSLDQGPDNIKISLIKNLLDIDRDLLDDGQSMRPHEAMDAISDLSEENKTAFCGMVLEVIKVSGSVKRRVITATEQMLKRTKLWDNLSDYSPTLYAISVTARFQDSQGL
jgi:hypothetical protein